jgi:hypothetical protein
MALTVAQLEKAEDLLGQITDKAAGIRCCVQQASAGVVEGITLTTLQVAALDERYLSGKQELLQVCQQLP